jgi:hypothetical protein
VVLVARRQALVAYNRQILQFPLALQRRECGLIEIGRWHARNFDAGHASSDLGAQLREHTLRAEVGAAAAVLVGR